MLADIQTTNVLGSWKEIACYLGKGVRTVQRWERHFGLPVRRLNVREKGIVYARPEELEHWLRHNWAQRAAESAASPSSGKQRKADPTASFSDLHANIRVAHQLRDANRRLIQDLCQLVHGASHECALLAAGAIWASEEKLPE